MNPRRSFISILAQSVNRLIIQHACFSLHLYLPPPADSVTFLIWNLKKVSPYSITERRDPELIPVLGSQPAGDVSHKPGSRLPLVSARPAVTPATLKRAATNFAAWWTEARWVWTVCYRTVTRQRRDCDLNPGPSAPESSTLTTRLPSHPKLSETIGR